MALTFLTLLLRARQASTHLVFLTGALAMVDCSRSPGATSRDDAAADTTGTDTAPPADAAVPTGSDVAPPASSDATATSPDALPGEAGLPDSRPGGCGLVEPAFCDQFDQPAPAVHGRAGELDPRWWSAGRIAPDGPTAGRFRFTTGPALLPSCRPGLPASVLPDQDTLLCEPRAEIRSSHLLTAVASQNYGQNSYRIRQPFDFEGRTGRIVFDAEGHISANGSGWISLEVTEDPAATPSYAFFGNDEGGAIPRNGFELQFNNSCGEGYSVATRVALKPLPVFRDYADTAMAPDSPTCISAREGYLNRFEVRVSRQMIEVWGTPASDDGVTFASAMLMYRAAVDLSFSRGYVHITTHNHASLKYTHPPQDWPQRVDATLARWDNVGFDGPVIANWREYEVADVLTPNHFDLAARPEDDDPYNPTHAAVDLGYIAPDAAGGPSATLHLPDVNLQDVTAARLSVTTWYPNSGPIEQYVLRYRFNGRAWHDHPLSPAEVALFRGPTVTGPANVSPMIRGALNQMIDVPLSDLLAGDNTLEFVTANVPQNYPAGVVNVDLILTTR